MLAFATAAALLGVTAWLILIGALIYGAVAAGVPWIVAAMVAIALTRSRRFFTGACHTVDGRQPDIRGDASHS